LLVHFGSGASVALTGAMLLGVGCGGENSIMSYFISRYFGVRNFSRVYGSLVPVLMLVSAPAPVLVGAIFDRTRSYSSAFLILEVGLAISVLAFALLKPFPFPTPEARKAQRPHREGDEPGSEREHERLKSQVPRDQVV
jgi:MFS family permease